MEIKQNSLRLSDAMKIYNKKFKVGVLNLLNAPTGCGKTTFITTDFLKNTTKYIEGVSENKSLSYDKRLSKILYVCDTRMLMDSVMSENNKIMTKFGKGSIIEANSFNSIRKILSEDNGSIKVMSYSTLGYYIKQDKKVILNNFDIILADEIQNLFKYSKRYNSETNKNGEKIFTDGEYVCLIDNLNEISKKALLIGLSGTVNSIYEFQKQFNIDFNLRNIFTEDERKTLYTHNFEPKYTNCIFNQIKSLDYNKVREYDAKILIYTRTIRQSENYKKWFGMKGLNAEWLCSVNNKKEIINKDEEGKEVIEKVKTMNNNQLRIRDRLLYGTDEKGNNKGTLPDDLDVLIVNSGYETGWNLTDERVQICFCDTSNHEEQQQARNRIRHNILNLWCLHTLYNEDGIVLDYNNYGDLIEREKQISTSIYTYVYVCEGKMKELDNKYIGIKLDKKLKDEIKFLYGIRGLNDKEVTWTTVKRDLLELGYEVKRFEGKNSGTYIFKQGEEIRKDIKREVKKMDKLEIVCNWLANKWDGIIIPVFEVRDILDFGRKSWENLIKGDEFNSFLESNNIIIGAVGGRGRTLYFQKIKN
ncbi:DEAD/DEAH box helicase family protein [Clostridium sp.]|uniref:DEAD/DEAH box helicase family protein n=1 Tax=Clostridium sp. TaxID=1506 RepID=UPI001D925D54|nr:DEAD/DEAH box helicase family protein [Clostridium sp.]MBS5937741.1 DEAD/DEAH box helicase family protein [Clostridium sp.]